MDIEVPKSDNKDIFDYGFDHGLDRSPISQGTPTVYDASDQIDTAQIAYGGNLVLKSLNIGGIIKTASPGDDLQAIIDYVSKSGGGTIQMAAGTYLMRSALTGRSNITFQGTSAASTIIQFAGAANLAFAGTLIYNTGTIVNISSNVVVTGSGTLWLTNVMTGMYMFIGTKWYLISQVVNDTTIILAEGYGDSVTIPANYRISNLLTNIKFADITFKSSTGTALSFTDCRDIRIDNTTLTGNNVGIATTNCSLLLFNACQIIANTSDGAQFTNCGFINAQYFLSAANGGNGITFNNISTGSWLYSSCDSNTGDGYNCTTMVNMDMTIEASNNGGQGVEFVTACNNNQISGLVNGNTSDGIKLTANDDGNIIGNGLIVTSNGGYGINIAASSCDNNTIAIPYFSSNVSGTISDSGTGTNTVLTSGAANYQTFTSSSTWTKPTGINAIYVTCIGGGGGGGGGCGKAAGNVRGGGSGGGGGFVISKNFAASDITSTVAITIGAGGTAGAAGSASEGGNGGGGGTTTFGSYLTAYGGGAGHGSSGSNTLSGGAGAGAVAAGQAGQVAGDSLGGSPATTSGSNGLSGQGAGGKAAADGKVAEYGGAAGAGTDNSTNPPTPYSGGSSIYSAGGGGSADGVTAAGGTNASGGPGGATNSYVAGGGGANGSGSAGVAGANGASTAGAGGGGGAGNALGAGWAGGQGGTSGGGGGAGAGGLNTGGAGGTGGRGEVRVIAW